MLGRAAGSKNRRASNETQLFIQGTSPMNKPFDSASAANETLIGMTGPVLKPVPDARVTFDGFPGHELQSASRKESRYRSYLSTKRNRRTVVRALTLRSGFLPLPAGANFDSSHEKRKHAQQGLLRPCTIPKRQHRRTGPNLAQLTLVKSWGMCQDDKSFQFA